MVKLPTIKKKTFDRVIDYCQYLNTNVAPAIFKPLLSEDLRDFVNEWYAQFVDNLTQEEAFELMAASNKL